MEDVVIVGAGTAGLATAAVLKKVHGVKSVVLEASASIGNSWAGRYNRLHLHTPKSTSGLPFKVWPKSAPMYPSKDEVQAFLQAYASEQELDVRTRHHVTRIMYDLKSDAYTVTAQVWEAGSAFSGITGKTSGKEAIIRAKCVVLATGAESVPKVPTLPGQTSFRGTVLHSSQYKDGAPFKGQRVLVVGFGNSAGEIALCLAEHGASPTLLVRKPSAVVIPRDDGLATSLLVKLDMKRWIKPYVSVLDKIMSPIMISQVPNLRPYGVPQVVPAYFGNPGIVSRIINHFDPPQMDVGQVKAIQSGAIKVMRGELRGFTDSAVLIAPPAESTGTPAAAVNDAGAQAAGGTAKYGAVFAEPQPHTFDAVVLCTGFDHSGSFQGLLAADLLARVVPPGHSSDIPVASGAEVPGQPGLYLLGWEDIIGRIALIGQEAYAISKIIAERVARSD